ncbi:transglycosylase domain-containing protein [Flavobacterium sp.]|uniref:transglycosylase domain-containing protein n=1 Tax=Flavobacterium sp. TaxID=239 RepID=UPI00262CB5F8|nr:biosynthetic peptidoglycan transglycosylase [Flavobacterium sp.]
MRINKQKLLLAAKILLAVLLLLVGGFIFFRDSLLNQALDKVSTKMTQQYNSNFTVKKASFDGMNGVDLYDVVLAPKNADTLLNIKNLKTSISFWNLFIGDIQLQSLELKEGYIQLVKKGKVKNFDAFLKKDEELNLENSDSKTDYAATAYRMISRLLNLVPTDMSIEKLAFKIDDNGKKAIIDIERLTLDNQELNSLISVETGTFKQHLSMKGLADPRNRKADIRIFNKDTGAIRLPYVDERYNLKSSFDSIRLNVDNIEKTMGEFHLDGFATITNLHVNHPKIANKDVVIKKARFDYRFLLGSDFISIDKSSTLQLNKIKLNPYMAYETESDTIYKLQVSIPKMKAQDFIVSLPDGLFTNFQGMEAQGNFEYNLDFKFNKNKPYQLVFDSKLNKENLRITKYGKANLTKLNGEFVYRAIIKNVLQRPIVVGTENPDYTPLDQISPYLQKCVLTTEDPSFFRHRGFINEAFKQSIIKNIRTKKFARGASTISMQLVKNVFLTREKTLSRKLEEILLVYILENNRVVSKERMLEVYFNIIEWGPDVYGIGEASRFYFQKTPAELDLNECLYLARIIPSPRKFMYQFNDEGNLKDYAAKQQLYLTNLMNRRGLLSPEDSIYKSKPFFITGQAKSFIKLRVPDSTKISVDSLATELPFEF